MRGLQPQQADAETEAWAVHRASQSPNVFTQTQVNWLIVAVFCSSFFLNLFTSPSASSKASSSRWAQLENMVEVVVLCMMTIVWIVLLVKIRESMVWPEELSFRRDGKVVLELGCGERVLNVSHGVILVKKRVNFCNSNLGVWANAITDKTRDEVFVLFPSSGPRFWTGFAFQPQDPGSFLYDCRHAGIVIQDESDVALVSASEEMMERGLLSDPRLPTPGITHHQQELTLENGRLNRSASGSSVSSASSALSEESSEVHSAESELSDVLKNTNIIEV